MTIPWAKPLVNKKDIQYLNKAVNSQKKKSMIEIPATYNRRTYGKSKSNFFILLFKYFFSAVILRFTTYK